MIFVIVRRVAKLKKPTKINTFYVIFLGHVHMIVIERLRDFAKINTATVNSLLTMSLANLSAPHMMHSSQISVLLSSSLHLAA